MAPTRSHLSNADVGALVRIASEVAGPVQDLQSRRRHVLEHLLALIGGCGAVCVEMDPRHASHSGWAIPDRITLAGPITSHDEVTRRYLTGGSAALDPVVPHLLRRRGAVVTIRRADVIDESWYRSEHYNELRRPHGLGESLYGTLMTPDGRRLKMTLHRQANDRPFSERDVSVLHLFNQNLGRLYAPEPAATAPAGRPPADGRIASLPPRLRPVLRRLLAGDAEKQAALALGLSRNTIHQYVNALYRSFGVNSRGELLAQFVVSD